MVEPPTPEVWENPTPVRPVSVFTSVMQYSMWVT